MKPAPAPFVDFVLAYPVTFLCDRCQKTILVFVAAQDQVTSEVIEQREFQLGCLQVGCGWGGRKYGREAIPIQTDPISIVLLRSG